MKITYSRRVSIDPERNESSVKGFLDIFVDKDSDWADMQRVFTDALTAMHSVKAGQHRISLVASQKPSIFPATAMTPYIEHQEAVKTTKVDQLEAKLAAIQETKANTSDTHLMVDPSITAEEQLAVESMVSSSRANMVAETLSLEHELQQARSELAAIKAKAALESPKFRNVPPSKKKTVGK